MVCPLSVNNRGTSSPGCTSQTSPELWAQRCPPYFTLFTGVRAICQKRATALALIEEQPKTKTHVTQNDKIMIKKKEQYEYETNLVAMIHECMRNTWMHVMCMTVLMKTDQYMTEYEYAC